VRKADLFFLVTGLMTLALASLLVFGPMASPREHAAARDASRAVVRELMLTDICLFTDAPYARHLSQADRHAAFQNHPFAMDLLPSGSMVAPPGHLAGGTGVAP
jgi:hypothetical protein